MKKVQCKEGLDIYKKFLTRMTRISEFLKVAEVRLLPVRFVLTTKRTLYRYLFICAFLFVLSMQQVGIDRGDIPDLSQVRVTFLNTNLTNH